MVEGNGESTVDSPEGGSSKGGRRKAERNRQPSLTDITRAIIARRYGRLRGHETRDGLITLATNMRRVEVGHAPSDLSEFAHSVGRGLDALEQSPDSDEGQKLIGRANIHARRYLGVDAEDLTEDKENYHNYLRVIFYTDIQNAMTERDRWYYLDFQQRNYWLDSN